MREGSITTAGSSVSCKAFAGWGFGMEEYTSFAVYACNDVWILVIGRTYDR